MPVPNNRVGPGGSPPPTYQDMMEVYDPEIDDLLEQLRRTKRGRTADREGFRVEDQTPATSSSDSVQDLEQPDSDLVRETERENELEEDSDDVECVEGGGWTDDEEDGGLGGHSLPSPQDAPPPPDTISPRGALLPQSGDKGRKPKAKRRAESSKSRAPRPGRPTSPQVDQIDSTSHNLKLIISPNKPGFFKMFIRAIKTDNIPAVTMMIQVTKEAGVKLGDSSKDRDGTTDYVSFTEVRYTATALHIALLFKRLEIAKLLISHFPDLVRIQYTSEDLRGQTAFHIAAANNDLEIMDLMLKVIERTDGVDRRAKEIDRRATGTYFEKNHQVGALCLTAALWAGHLEMIRLLLERGANMAATGPSGNTALHQLVKFSHKYREKQKTAQDMFDIFWEYCDRDITSAKEEYSSQKATHNKVVAMRELLSIRNDNKQTPLMLAVNLQAPIAKYLLNFEPLYRQPQTKYGSTSWITYDVTEVTSYSPEKPWWDRYNPSSVLHILSHRAKIVSCEDQTFQDLIRVQPVSDLVKMKWKVYRWIYYLWAILHSLNMVGLTWFATDYRYASVNTTNASVNAPVFIARITGVTNKRFAWIFLVLPLIYIIMETEDILVTLRSWKIEDILVTIRSWKILCWRVFGNSLVTGNGPLRVTLFSFSVCSLVWALMLEFDHGDRDIPLIFSVGLGWIFMLFFTRGFKSTAQFSIMVQKMFFKDFLYFFSVYSFVWIAFVSAMQILLETQTMGDTIYSMLNIMTDAGEKATEQISRRPALAAVILSCYAVISVILLLNMLIAMMNASYDAVKMSKTKLYRYQQLSILLLLERRLFWFSWLCKRSQKHLWSPKKDEIHVKTIRSKSDADVEAGDSISAKQTTEQLTTQRIYVEVTEKNFANNNNVIHTN